MICFLEGYTGKKDGVGEPRASTPIGEGKEVLHHQAFVARLVPGVTPITIANAWDDLPETGIYVSHNRDVSLTLRIEEKEFTFHLINLKRVSISR